MWPQQPLNEDLAQQGLGGTLLQEDQSTLEALFALPPSLLASNLYESAGQSNLALTRHTTDGLTSLQTAWHVGTPIGSFGREPLSAQTVLVSGDAIYTMDVPLSQQQQHQQLQAVEVTRGSNNAQLNLVRRLATGQQVSNVSHLVGDTLYVTTSPEASVHATTQASQITELDAWGLPGWCSAPGVLVHTADSTQSQQYHSQAGEQLLVLQHFDQASGQTILQQQSQVEQLQAQLQQLQEQLQAQQLADPSSLQQRQRTEQAAALQQLQQQRSEAAALQQVQVAQQRALQANSQQLLQQQQQQLLLQAGQSVSQAQPGQVWQLAANQQLPSQTISAAAAAAGTTQGAAAAAAADNWSQQSSTAQVQRLLESIQQNAQLQQQQQQKQQLQLQSRLRQERITLQPPPGGLLQTPHLQQPLSATATSNPSQLLSSLLPSSQGSAANPSAPLSAQQSGVQTLHTTAGSSTGAGPVLVPGSSNSVGSTGSLGLQAAGGLGQHNAQALMGIGPNSTPQVGGVGQHTGQQSLAQHTGLSSLLLNQPGAGGQNTLTQQGVLPGRRAVMPRLPGQGGLGPVNPRMMHSHVRAQPPMWAGADWNPRMAAQAISASGTGVFLPQIPSRSCSSASTRTTPTTTPPASGSTQPPSSGSVLQSPPASAQAAPTPAPAAAAATATASTSAAGPPAAGVGSTGAAAPPAPDAGKP